MFSTSHFTKISLHNFTQATLYLQATPSSSYNWETSTQWMYTSMKNLCSEIVLQHPPYAVFSCGREFCSSARTSYSHQGSHYHNSIIAPPPHFFIAPARIPLSNIPLHFFIASKSYIFADESIILCMLCVFSVPRFQTIYFRDFYFVFLLAF